MTELELRDDKKALTYATFGTIIEVKKVNKAYCSCAVCANQLIDTPTRYTGVAVHLKHTMKILFIYLTDMKQCLYCELCENTDAQNFE